MILFLFIVALIAAASYGLTLLVAWPLYAIIPLSIVSVLVLFFLFVLLILLPIFSKTSPKGKFKHFVFRQVASIIFFIARTPYKVEGLENLIKESDEPLVIVSNHKSNMDGVWLHTILKRPLTAVGKQDLLKNFLYAKIINAYKVVTIDRENNRSAAQSINKAIDLVKGGLPMMIFTEGGIKTRETGQMVSVRPGAYKLAFKSEANIQLMAIHNSNTIKTRKKFSKTKITVKILPPIMFEEYKDMTTTELGLKVASIVNKTFDEPQVEVEVL